ncbi:hypothetical protein CCYA_CCYA01G0341 [Cyanidiococcus yangmingshanensis]|nr:hypothetical protein CCYA_CCYA01G0341 [Cyanidiococcus yangmingshanensis]
MKSAFLPNGSFVVSVGRLKLLHPPWDRGLALDRERSPSIDAPRARQTGSKLRRATYQANFLFGNFQLAVRRTLPSWRRQHRLLEQRVKAKATPQSSPKKRLLRADSDDPRDRSQDTFRRRSEAFVERTVSAGPLPQTGGNSGSGGSGGGDSSGNGNGRHGDRHDGHADDGDSESIDSELAGVLRAYRRPLESLPPELIEAVRRCWIERRTLARYLAQDRGLVGWLLQWRFFRDRVLADPEFIFKLLAQEYIGNGTQLVGEFLVRGREIVDELEYVLSDLIVGTVVEASFVVLLAPSVPFPQMQHELSATFQRGWWQTRWNRYLQWAQSLPANAFEKSIPPLRVYPLPSRVLTVLHTSAQYFLIGFACGIVGTAITYGLLGVRRTFDPAYKPARPMPPVVPNSVGWGAFMALSSNPRFQLVEGLERLSHMLLANHALWNRVFIVTLRFMNNFYGGINFVQFFRWAGLQATGDGGS